MHVATIPTPPSVNGLYRNGKYNPRVKTERYMTWLNAAVPILRVCLPQFPGRVLVLIGVSEKHTGDIDNRQKAVLDALVKAGRIPDDQKRYVRFSGAQWCEHLPKYLAEITVVSADQYALCFKKIDGEAEGSPA